MAEKILIVDDDLETLKLVGLMLQRQGYQIIAANNGAQAIQLAASDIPDLILLDVMMPDMDGYEVTRRLRSQPSSTTTPILMFTAKSQVDDKVTGYEAGVDDYLTKPTHPAELTAHVKALLARTHKNAPAAQLPDKGRVIGFLSAKGGTGTSTLTLNTGILLHQQIKSNVNLVELRPGFGTWGTELGYSSPEGLSRLAQMKVNEITLENVEKELTNHASGIKMLLASNHLKDMSSANQIAQYRSILDFSSRLAPVTLVDIGTVLFPAYDKILEMCDELVIVVEPHPTTVSRTKHLLESLSEMDFGKAKLITLAQVNRVRADVMLSWTQIQETLGFPVTIIITPAPELAYQAALRFTPMVLLQADGLTTQQIGKLADQISQRVRP